MLHACIDRFDVLEKVFRFLGETKQALNALFNYTRSCA